MFFPAFVLLIECFICSIFQPTVSTDMSNIAFVLLIINVFVLIYAVSLSVDNARIRAFINVSTILRVFVALWDLYAQNIFILPNAEGDAIGYRTVALSYAFGGRANIINFSDYSFYLGQLYKFIGVQHLSAEFINVFLAVCSLVFIYKILLSFDIEDTIIYKALFLACFLPNSLIVTTTTLQEGVISFCIITTVYCYVKWWFSDKKSYILLALLFSFFGGLLHIGGLVPGLCIAVFTPLVNNPDRKIQITSFRVILAVIVTMVLLMVLSNHGDTLLRKLGGELSAQAIISHADLTGDIASADYFAGINGLPTVLDIMVNTPIRAFYFICSPLPWMWRKFSDIMAFFFSALFYIQVFILAVKAYKAGKGWNSEEQIWSLFVFVILTTLLGAVMFGWGVSNMGTALRHREKFTYVCIILYAIANEIIMRKNQCCEENICYCSGV